MYLSKLIKCRYRYFLLKPKGERTNQKKRSCFDRYKKESVIENQKVISKKAYKKILSEVVEILYDHYRQQQRISLALLNELGEPQTQREVA